jgi:hypothetical protein
MIEDFKKRFSLVMVDVLFFFSSNKYYKLQFYAYHTHEIAFVWVGLLSTSTCN